MNNIGFMQGRLVNQVDGKIQAFPTTDWQKEFPLGASADIRLMEWTLDHEMLHENPLMTEEGRRKIHELMSTWQFEIPSLTADFFMQAPFFKASPKSKIELEQNFLDVLENCISVGIKIIVVPLVDNASIRDFSEEEVVVDFFLNISTLLKLNGMKIAFESDYNTDKLKRFITCFPKDTFGINYDMGNSAALGFCPDDEFEKLSNYILNVHVKDRNFGGNTVPLNEGDVEFKKVFSNLAAINYTGNYILQTARSEDGKHLSAIKKYKDFVEDLLSTKE